MRAGLVVVPVEALQACDLTAEADLQRFCQPQQRWNDVSGLGLVVERMRIQAVLIQELRDQYIDGYGAIDVAAAEPVVARHGQGRDGQQGTGGASLQPEQRHIAGAAAEVEDQECAGLGELTEGARTAGDQIVQKGSNRLIEQRTADGQIESRQRGSLNGILPLRCLKRRGRRDHGLADRRRVIGRRGLGEEAQHVASDLAGGPKPGRRLLVGSADADVVLAVPEDVAIQLQIGLFDTGAQVLRAFADPHLTLM